MKKIRFLGRLKNTENILSTIIKKLSLFLFLTSSLLLFGVENANAWNSGTSTEDIKLAIDYFIRNGVSSAKLLRVGPCPKEGPPKAKFAANLMLSLNLDLRAKYALADFGLAALDAAVELTPVSGLSAKAAKKAYQKLREVHKHIEKKQRIKSFTTSRNIKCNGKNSKATLTVVVNLDTMEITAHLRGNCTCGEDSSLRDMEYYVGFLKGRVEVTKTVEERLLGKKTTYKWRFVGYVQRFGGLCCEEKVRPGITIGMDGSIVPRTQITTGKGVKPTKPGGTKPARREDEGEEQIDCEKYDCKDVNAKGKALYDEYKKLVDERKRLKDKMTANEGKKKRTKALEDEYKELYDAYDRLYSPMRSIEPKLKQQCRIWKKCKCKDKLGLKDDPEWFKKFCKPEKRIGVGMFYLPGSQTGVPISYGVPAVLVESVRNEPCTLNPVNDPVLVTLQPGRESINISQGPPSSPIATYVPVPVTGKPTDKPTDEPKDKDKEKTPPAPPAVYIVKTQATVLEGNKTVVKPVPGSTVKISLDPDPQLARGDDEGFNEDPVISITDDKGNAQITSRPLAGTQPGGGTATITLDVTPMDGKLLHMAESLGPAEGLHPELIPYVRSIMNVDGEKIVVILFPRFMSPQIAEWLVASDGIVLSERDFCRIIQTTPNDPYFFSKGSWDQEFDDQWAIKRVGFTAGSDSAWALVGDNPSDVVVAVVDSGIDWNHRDFSWNSLWKNTNEIPDNGIDDDGNGYVDDIIGWDFIRDINRPWDRSGHGTIVAGIIAADTDNGIGIAGINPNAKIMVLKAMNNFGQTRASFVVEAILYAVNNGARIINLSMGGKGLTQAEQKAVDFANKNGVIIIAAAGNEGEDVTDMGPAGLEHVIAVAATDMKDNWPLFSNWGMKIDVAAPGVDVLSLRARRTDVMRDLPGARYMPGESYVGKDRRYYRAGGTSFSAPIVSGVASLLLSKNPDLTSEQVKRVILHSAEDINVPGFDQFTGYGLLDARAALKADSEFFIETRIHGVKAVQKGEKVLLEITGTADADKFKMAWIEIGEGENPKKWKKVSKNIMKPVLEGVLTAIPAETFKGVTQWKLRLVAEHMNGRTWEARFDLRLQ